MRVVFQRTNVRLPKVLDAWEKQEGEDRVGYILMQYVHGNTLDTTWPSLDEDTRQADCTQVNDSLHEVRKVRLSVPGPCGGDVSRGALFTDYGAGPFQTSTDLENWFNERLLVCQEFERASQQQPSFSGEFQDLVMCHMDIAPQNLILDNHGKLWILDWAFAGGYPVSFDGSFEEICRSSGFCTRIIEHYWGRACR